MVNAIPPKAPMGANNITQCNALKTYLLAMVSGFIILSLLLYLLKKIPNAMERNSTCIVRLSFKNFNQLNSVATVVYFETSPPCTADVFIPLPGCISHATRIPMMSATVVTISKYKSALPPTLPTFFKLPIPLMPSEIVRKMIGLINSFTISIK